MFTNYELNIIRSACIQSLSKIPVEGVANENLTKINERLIERHKMIIERCQTFLDDSFNDQADNAHFRDVEG